VNREPALHSISTLDHSEAQTNVAAPSPVPAHVAWSIVALLVVATVLNYLDRQSLSILVPFLQRSFHISDIGYGNIVTAFFVAYTIAYALSGFLIDRIGVRNAMALVIAWWSAAELLPPLTHTTLGLGIARFLLGLGEAGVWVVAPKAIAQIFPVDRRGTAIGFCTSGATFGAVLSAPLIASLTPRWGWPSVFFLSGVVGLLWVIPWLLLFPRSLQTRSASTPVLRLGWRRIFTSPALYLLIMARFLADSVWYFYLFWFPKYMAQARHMSLSGMGRTLWFVYFMADIGAIFGGYISGVLIRRWQFPAMRARRAVMLGAAAMMALNIVVALTSSANIAILAAGFVCLAYMAWNVAITTFVVDVFPTAIFGVAFGLIAAGSGLGGLLSAQIIAHTIPSFGYHAIFYAMVLIHPVALGLVAMVKKMPEPAAVPETIVGASA
jgi:ACS family hexuronate transporter-like MFS transporter